MEKIIVTKSQTIDVVVDSITKQSFQLTQSNNDGKLIEEGMVYGVIVHKVAQLTISPKNNATVNETVRQKAYLELADGNRNVDVLSLPVYLLDPSLNSGTPFLFKPRKVNLSASKINVPSVTGLVLNEAFVITFLYQ